MGHQDMAGVAACEASDAGSSIYGLIQDETLKHIGDLKNDFMRDFILIATMYVHRCVYVCITIDGHVSVHR